MGDEDRDVRLYRSPRSRLARKVMVFTHEAELSRRFTLAKINL